LAQGHTRQVHTIAAEIGETLEEIIRKSHEFPARDLVIALWYLPGNPSLQNRPLNAIGKLSRNPLSPVSLSVLQGIEHTKYVTASR
jgi:hypothetical protein